MSTCRVRSAASAIAAGAAIVVAGCQQYEPMPLDPAGHEAAWRSRLPSDESVRDFAARLADAGQSTPGRFNPSDGLTMAEGELVALVFNPDLRIARLRAGVAAVSAEHAGLWDDPEFAIDVLRVTESVSNPWVITPGLSFTIPISGRLEVEKARADAASRVALHRVAEEEWAVRKDVRLAWLEWSAALWRLEQQEALLGSVTTLGGMAASLAEAGEMPRTEAALFALERAQREHERARMRGRIIEAEQRLRALLGLAPDAPVGLTPALAVEAADGPPVDADLATASLTLARLREEYEVAEQLLRREIRKQYPDLTIGPLYETDQGQSRIGFLGAIPIPVLNANRRGIAEAEAERALARAAYETEHERLIGAVASTRARAASLSEERASIENDLAPLVDRQLADAQRLLEVGESGGLVLLESLVRALDAKLHLIDVRLDEARARADLLFLLGADPLPSPIDSPLAPDSADDGEVTP